MGRRGRKPGSPLKLFRILLDGPMEVRGPNGLKPHGEIIADLAGMFKGESPALRARLEMWEKVDSAIQYGLLQANFPVKQGLENLRLLVEATERLEREVAA